MEEQIVVNSVNLTVGSIFHSKLNYNLISEFSNPIRLMESSNCGVSTPSLVVPDVCQSRPDPHYELNNKYNVFRSQIFRCYKLYLHSPIKIPVSSPVFLLIFFLRSLTMVCLGFTFKYCNDISSTC